jgi:hypothetical protein
MTEFTHETVNEAALGLQGSVPERITKVAGHLRGDSRPRSELRRKYSGTSPNTHAPVFTEARGWGDMLRVILSPDPTSVFVSEQELPEAIDGLVERRFFTNNQDRRNRVIAHAMDEAAVLRGIGARVLHMLPLVQASSGDIHLVGVRTLPVGIKVPKLGMVAALAHPLHNIMRENGGPSAINLSLMEELGCLDGVQEAGELIAAWNADGNTPQLPMPRTYRSAA